MFYFVLLCTMDETLNQKNQLKIFFNNRNLEIDKEVLTNLDRMSEEEINILYEMIFAKSEIDRLKQIDKFYSSMENKMKDANKYLYNMKKMLNTLVQTLWELDEKSQNESKMEEDLNNI